MKRIIPFIVVLSLLVTVVVSAESNNKYNGYDIVKVNVNNTELSLDVPAIVMNGRTLLPIRKVAEAVNGIVTWDGNTKTASILKPHVNIIFAESKDGSSISGEPSEIIPFWTEYDRYLSYISISGLSAGNHTLYCGIFKTDKNNNIDFNKPVDTKTEQTINSTGPYTPAMFALAWDKANIKEAGTYYFMVNLKDDEGNFKPIASYSMELK